MCGRSIQKLNLALQGSQINDIKTMKMLLPGNSRDRWSMERKTERLEAAEYDYRESTVAATGQ